MSIIEYLNHRDALFNIKSFLRNNDIIELVTSSKKINSIIGHANIFTSITIDSHSNLCDMIRLYLKNKASIIHTIIIGSSDPIHIWPFSSKTMIFINCPIHQAYIEQNYKNSKTILLSKKYQHFWT
jgi:hypothetical protein